MACTGYLGKIGIYWLAAFDRGVSISFDPYTDPYCEIFLWKQWSEQAQTGFVTGEKRPELRWKAPDKFPGCSYGPEGRGFESLTAYQKAPEIFDFRSFLFACFAAARCSRPRDAWVQLAIPVFLDYTDFNTRNYWENDGEALGQPVRREWREKL